MYTWDKVNLNFFLKFGYELFSLAKHHMPTNKEKLPDLFVMVKKPEGALLISPRLRNEGNAEVEEHKFQEILSVMKEKRPNQVKFCKDFLYDSHCNLYFKTHLKESKNEENLLFWEQVEIYKSEFYFLFLTFIFKLFVSYLKKLKRYERRK